MSSILKVVRDLQARQRALQDFVTTSTQVHRDVARYAEEHAALFQQLENSPVLQIARGITAREMLAVSTDLNQIGHGIPTDLAEDEGIDDDDEPPKNPIGFRPNCRLECNHS